MSQENVEIVRQRITVGARSHRRLEERVFLRFPAVFRLAAKAMWRLPPSSRLRRLLLARSVRLGFEAFNRRDDEATYLFFHPDVESTFPPQLASIGFAATAHGRRQRIEAQRGWNEEWGDFRNEPEELVDLGDRMLVLGRITGFGPGSGVGIDNFMAYLFEISDGLITGEQIFVDRAQALEAAGLRE